MSNVAFLWIFSRGMELGVIVLCLLPLRALLRRKVPRLFSYLLWTALPVNVVYNLGICFLPRQNQWISDYMCKLPPVILDEDVVRIWRWIWSCGTILIVTGMVYTYIRFLHCLVGSIRLQKGIYLAARIRSPFTLGIFCPKIYLPTSLKEEYREAVVLHEQVHIARKDVWMKYLAVVLCCLFMMVSIPISWQVPRIVRAEWKEEISTDNMAMQETGIERKTKIIIEETE